MLHYTRKCNVKNVNINAKEFVNAKVKVHAIYMWKMHRPNIENILIIWSSGSVGKWLVYKQGLNNLVIWPGASAIKLRKILNVKPF